MKKRLLYLIPALFLLSGCGKSVSISINLPGSESKVSESGDTDESEVTDATKAIESTKESVKKGVEMLDANVYYKPQDGYQPPENIIPQIKADNKNLEDTIKKINSIWTSDYSKIQLTRYDSNIFSLLIDTVKVDNSASSEELRGVNISSSTGKELKITAVLKDAYTLYEKLMSDHDFVDDYDDIDNFSEKLKSVLTDPDAFTDGENKNGDVAWSLSNGALMIYMLENTKYGKQSVSIPIDYIKYKEFFKPDVLTLPDDYAFKIIPDREMTVNIGGIERVVEVDEDIDEYGVLQEVELKIDGVKREYKDDSYSYGITDAYIFKKGNSAYLYLELTYDNDYRSIKVIDLNNDKQSDISECFADTAPLNPNKFYLGERVATISTVNVERKYTLGEGGSPKALENYYTVVTPVSLVAKTELSGERLKGINGSYDGSITLPVGILLTPVGSDNETFTDYSTSSGDIIRIPMQKSSDGDITINGRDVRDVFDGTFFAG